MLKMFPTKSMVDYMTEMSRLFPRPESENAYSLAPHSPYGSTINRSSSSTDSASPESFSEISTFQPNYNLRPMPDTPKLVYSTPPPTLDSIRPIQDTPKASDTTFLAKRQRPIIGRKILPADTSPNYERVQVTPVTKIPEDDFLASIWSEEPVLQHTPPNVHNIYINNTNVYYELFPTDNKGYEFQSPVKTSPTPSSNMSNISPTSPTQSPMSLTPTFHQHSPSAQSFRPSSSRYSRSPTSSRYSHETGQKMCTFCRKNGETPIVYMTHSVKEKVGNKFIVSCPILRSHVCSTCGATGDDSHTITYCPVLRSTNNGQPLQSTTITLKNTRIKSNGRRRY